MLDVAPRNQVLDSLGPPDCEGSDGTSGCYAVTKGDRRYELEVEFSSTNPNAVVVGVGIGSAALTVRSVPVRANTR